MHKWLGLIGQEPSGQGFIYRRGNLGTSPICVVCCHRISRESQDI